MIGVATGLSAENFNVVTTTFAPFQTIRCCEQIKINLGYMKHKVTLVGLASGLALGNLGFTHCCIEDIGILRSIPNMVILSADFLETVKCLQESLKSESPVYIRLTGTSNNPIINDQDYKFEIGKSIEIKSGKDITIFSNGRMVHNSLIAAEKLEKLKFSTSVVNMHTIKPIDVDAIKKAEKSKLIVSVEEHNIIGGLGSAIAEQLSNIEGSTNSFELELWIDIVVEEVTNIFKKHGLDPDNIVETILKNFK